MILGITREELETLNIDLVANSFFTECQLPGHFCHEAFIHNWKLIFDAKLGAMWKLVIDGKIVGLMGGILSPDMLDGQLIATEAFWYVHPDFRRSKWGLKLIAYFEQWARSCRAQRLIMAHLLVGFPESLAAYYSRKGFRPVEINYVKELL